jgi:hypothetical protein
MCSYLICSLNSAAEWALNRHSVTSLSLVRWRRLILSSLFRISSIMPRNFLASSTFLLLMFKSKTEFSTLIQFVSLFRNCLFKIGETDGFWFSDSEEIKQMITSKGVFLGLIEGTVTHAKVLSSRNRREKEDRIGESQPLLEPILSIQDKIRLGRQSPQKNFDDPLVLYFTWLLMLNLSFYWTYA